MDGRCTICDADDIQAWLRVMRGKRSGAAYCHACGRRVTARTRAAVWICGACTFLLAVAVLLIYVLR